MMTNHDRYLSVVNRLRRRYQSPNGTLIISTGGKLSRYAALEDLAAVKYLGVDPIKIRRKGVIYPEEAVAA